MAAFIKRLVVEALRTLGLVAATPSADEATGGPFASDSLMLIVCADGHDDAAKSTDEQQTGSAAEHSEASASASKDQRALIEKLQSIVGALEPASDEEFAEALKTIKGLVEEFEKAKAFPREDALGSAARAAEEAATEAVDRSRPKRRRPTPTRRFRTRSSRAAGAQVPLLVAGRGLCVGCDLNMNVAAELEGDCCATPSSHDVAHDKPVALAMWPRCCP